MKRVQEQLNQSTEYITSVVINIIKLESTDNISTPFGMPSFFFRSRDRERKCCHPASQKKRIKNTFSWTLGKKCKTHCTVCKNCMVQLRSHFLLGCAFTPSLPQLGLIQSWSLSYSTKVLTSSRAVAMSYIISYLFYVLTQFIPRLQVK